MGANFSTVQDNRSPIATLAGPPARKLSGNKSWSFRYHESRPAPEAKANTNGYYGVLPERRAPPPVLTPNYKDNTVTSGHIILPESRVTHGVTVVPPTKVATANQVIAFHSSASWRAYFELSKMSDKLIVMNFTATWCGPCRKMEPTLNEFAAKYTNVEIVKIDVDELFNVSDEYGVQSMPTFLLMKKGKVIDKVVGVRKEELQRKIESHSKDVTTK